ncbi:hypothetical protein ACKI10_46550, partial [Streptomyces galilaeus]|uniref:hypothetical protein n=1 Tax=Streptomyces galilaeus TaxID=33899 RepID=UPI0038F623BA
GKTNEDTLMQIAQGWKDLTPDQRKLSLDEMVKVIVQKNLHKIFGQGTHVENMDFAMEAAKWWQEDEADDWHGDEDDYDDDDDDVTYESL